MSGLRVLVLGKRTIMAVAALGAATVLISLSILLSSSPANQFADPNSGILVIDPGHGGIDGGANREGILEKDINLAVAKKLRTQLEEKSYKVVMTREEDTSLEHLCDLETSRHQKDLQARADIINSCNAQLFVSIHVNCNFKRPATDGSIVFYNDQYAQNRELAYSIQRALNGITSEGGKRTVHDPQKGEFFVLKYAQIPGVIIETAFLSNEKEKRLLVTEEFQELLATAICDGIDKFLKETEGKQVRSQDGR